jgi:nitrate reductase gamma subunit
MKNLYKFVAMACAGISVIFILLGGIALLMGGRMFGNHWISYLTPSHYLMMFGILMLLFILVERKQQE